MISLPFAPGPNTISYGAPKNWDEAEHGPCATLSVYRDPNSGTLWSMWEPTPEELQKLNDGVPILLGIMAPVHPVIVLAVQQPFSDGENET